MIRKMYHIVILFESDYVLCAMYVCVHLCARVRVCELTAALLKDSHTQPPSSPKCFNSLPVATATVWVTIIDYVQFSSFRNFLDVGHIEKLNHIGMI